MKSRSLRVKSERCKGKENMQMNKESYFYLLWKNVWNSISIMTGICGIALAFVFWIWKPEQNVSLALCITIGVFIFFFFFVFVRFSIDLYANKKQNCTVLTIIETYGKFKDTNNVIALTTCIDYFTENGIVTVFYLENGFERQIALGKIINIQEDKKVQILFFEIDSDFSTETLLKNNRELLNKLRIKPIIKMTSLEEIRYGK